MPTSHVGGTSHRLHKKLANPFDENTGTTQGIGWVQRRLFTRQPTNFSIESISSPCHVIGKVMGHAYVPTALTPLTVYLFDRYVAGSFGMEADWR